MKRCTKSLAALAIAATANTTLAQPSFTFIGDGIGITDLSEDGTVAVGNTIADGLFETFRWTQDTGWVRLGRSTVDVIGTGAGSPDVSYDGTKVSATIIGPEPQSRGTTPPYATQGLWTQGQGWTELLPPPAPDGTIRDKYYGSAWGLSGDGITVSGLYQTNSPLFGTARPCFATTAGPQGLTGENGKNGRVNAVNFDGTIGCGWTEAFNGPWMPTVWRDGTHAWLVTDLGTGNVTATAEAINADGSVIVGKWYDPQAARRNAARWDWNGSAYVLTDLGVLPGTPQTSVGHVWANSVSDDGNIVVGTNRFNENGPYSVQTGFVWTPENGMQDIADVLSDHGFPLPANHAAVGLVVSPDGSAIGGFTVDSTNFPGLSYKSFIFRYAPPAPPCVGDLDGDDDTDVFDFNIFAPAFGTSLGDPGFIPAADLNDDDSIDVFDFNLFAPDFGCNNN